MKLDSLSKREMNSGHLCLDISSEIEWREFPNFVKNLLQNIGGDIIEKNDAVDLRIWNVNFGNEMLRCVWDDFPMMVSLESSSFAGDQKICEIFDILRNKPTIE